MVGVFDRVHRKIDSTITVDTNKKIQFRDTGVYINSNADGKLTISSDGSGDDDITFSGNTTFSDKVTMSGNLVVNGDFTFGDASTDTLTVDGFLNLASGNGYIYPRDTENSTRKDGVILITGSRSGSQDTQKIVDINGAPGSTYNSWDAFTGAAANKDTILLNVDGKRINTAATGAVTDRGFNISVENQTDSSGGTLDLVGAHIKAESDAGTGKDSKLNDLKSMHLETTDSGSSTIAGESVILELQASGSLSSQTTGDTSAIKFTGEDNVDFAFNFTDSGTGGAIEDSGNLKDSGTNDILCDGYIVVQTNAGTKYLALYDTTV